MRKPQTQEQWTRLQTLLQLACCDSARTNPLNHKTPSAETPNLKTLKTLNPLKAQAPPPKKKKKKSGEPRCSGAPARLRRPDGHLNRTYYRGLNNQNMVFGPQYIIVIARNYQNSARNYSGPYINWALEKECNSYHNRDLS